MKTSLHLYSGIEPPLVDVWRLIFADMYSIEKLEKKGFRKSVVVSV
jgi:hypothetical protein